MKIISLQAENLKRLVAVEIRPDGNLVEITGKNGQGKTSVLDSIWWALTGSEHIQAAPIRKGQTEARIRLDLGELIITRTFRRRATDGETTTGLAVESADGARFPSPQKVLDSLLGELCFDPLGFARMKAKDQFNALRKFVPGIDFEGIANQNHGDYEKRTELNRFAKQERAAAAALIVPPDTPEEMIDEANLVDQISEAAAHNAYIETRKIRRQDVAEQIERLKAQSEKLLDGIPAAIKNVRDRRQVRNQELTDRIEELEAELLELRDRLEANKNATDKEIAQQERTIREVAAEKITEASGLQAQLDEAKELPAPIDAGALRARIEAARATNQAVARLQERRKHEVRAGNAEKQAQALTEAIDARNAAKQAAIAAAEMPVAGIGFGDDQVLLNGVPFEQGSDAEQLQASVKIAAAMNPKLRVIRIRDGSLLDDEAMTNLAAFAAEQDMQIWVERVDSSGAIGFVIEDGQVRKAKGKSKGGEEAAA